MDRLYCIDSAAVVSDIIDGEVVMLHRRSGDYFSTEGVGCLIWQWLAVPRDRGQILDLAGARFAADPQEIEAAVDSFLAELVVHQLVRTTEPGVAPAAAPADPPADPGTAFVRPVLNVYSDIRTLLLLDPIHDVAPAAGWPAPKPADGPP